MKRILVLIALALLPLSLSAQKTAASYRHLYNLVGEYKGVDGFEAVRLGPVATSLARGVLGFASLEDRDEEAMILIRAARKIRSITFVDYDDCSDAVKKRFAERVSRLLEGCALLMEVNSDGEAFQIYGRADEKSGLIRDCVLFAPGDHALVCLSGAVSVDALAELIQQ